jgi:hypothetical protein
MSRSGWIWIALLCSASPLAAQQAASADKASTAALIVARRAPTSPKVDGKLDDAVWQDAQWISEFIQREPQEGQPASDRTEVAIYYDDDAVYIGARMQSSDPAGVRALVTRRDREESSEQLLVSLDTYHDRRTAYSFGVTAAGVRIDYYHASDFESNRDYSYDPVWQAETQRSGNGWTAEIRIPFTQLRFNSGSEQAWGINIVRSIPAKNEIAYWRLVGRNETGWSSRMGQLVGIQGIRPSRRIEMLPYVASDTRVQSEIEAANPFAQKTATGVRAGGDIRMGLGPNLTLEATINPDFGQVEADPAEVNLTAYETFFAERRPFFLEGTQLLNSRGNFYSRRIGARPLSSVPGATYVEQVSNSTILGAAKLTGRYRSGLSVAALTAFTQGEKAQTFSAGDDSFGEALVAPGTWYGAGVVQQEFGNPAKTSSVGYVLITGVERGLDDNFLRSLFADRAYTGIADYRIRWKGGQYDMSTFLAWSWLQGDTAAMRSQQTSSRRFYQRPDAGYVSVDPLATTLFGTYFGINHSKLSGKHWLWDFDYYQEAPGYELNDVGRLGSSDDRGISANFRYRERTPGKVFRSYELGLAKASEWNFGGTRQFDIYELFTNDVLKNFWNVSAYVDYYRPIKSDNLTRGGPLMGLGKQYVGGLNVSNRSGSRTRLRGGVTVGDDDMGGWTGSATAGISFRPGTQWEVTIDPRVARSANTRQFITTMFGTGRAETYHNRYVFSTVDRSELSARFRVNYAITPELTLETYAEPFAASGRFYDFGEMGTPRSEELRLYGTGGTTISQPDANGRRTVVADGQTFTLSNQDFNARSFRSNMVLRWEWRPGSTLFLVWQQDRAARLPSGEHVQIGDVWNAFSQSGSNFFAVKMNYWLPIR